MRQFDILTGFLLSKSSNPTINDTVEFKGYAAIGDGGGATWQHNGVTGQTASQTPVQLDDILLNDASGNQWKLVVKKGVVSSLQVGHVGDGVADDTVFIRVASKGGAVKLPPLSLITSLVLSEGSSLIGADSGSVVHCNNGAGITNVFLPVSSGVDLLSTCENVTFIAKNIGGTCVETQSGASISQTNKPRYIFNSLLFKGTTLGASGSVWQYDQGWEKCLSIGDTFLTSVDGMKVYGTYNIEVDQATSPDDIGIFVDGLQSVRAVVITNYQTSDVKKPLDIGNNVTSLWLDKFDMSRSQFGISSSHTGNSSELQLTSGYVNSQYTGIKLNKRSWAFIDRVNVTRHPSGFDHTGDWVGLDLGVDFNDASISDMRILDAGSWVNVGTRTAVKMDDVLRCKFNHITCDSSVGNLDFGFSLTNSCLDNVFNNSIFDDIDVFWDFGVGTSDVSTGLFEHRGSFNKKFQFDASISTSSINDDFDLHGYTSIIETDDATHETIQSMRRVTGQRWDTKVATNDEYIIRDVTAGVNIIELLDGGGLMKLNAQIRPTSNNLRDNGSSSFAWRNTFTNKISMVDTVTAGVVTVTVANGVLVVTP